MRKQRVHRTPVAQQVKKEELWYNANLKLDFVNDDQVCHSPKVARTLFSRAVEAEETLQKDISLFNKDELTKLFVSTNMVRPSYFTNICSILTMYVKYCIKKGIANEQNLSVIQELKSNGIPADEVVNKSYYFSDEDVVERTSLILEKAGYDLNYYARFVVINFLLFHQVDYPDIINLICDNVHLNENGKSFITVTRDVSKFKEKYVQENIEIPECVLPYFDSCLNATSYQMFSNGRTAPIYKHRYLIVPRCNGHDYERKDKGAAKSSTYQQILRTIRETSTTISEQYTDEIPNSIDVYNSGVFLAVHRRLERYEDKTLYTEDVVESMYRISYGRVAQLLRDEYPFWLANLKRQAENDERLKSLL